MENNFIYSNSGIITINRGDSLSFPVFINKGSLVKPRRYYLTENDKLYFGVMEPNEFFENSIIRKVYDYHSETDVHGDTLIKLYGTDTEFLIPGTYYYMVKLRSVDFYGKEEITTIIPKTLFYII